MSIAATGDFLRVVKRGKADPEQCYDAFEKIIKENSQVAGQYEFSMMADARKMYALLLSDYIAINAALTILMFECDNENISFLKRKGYKIDLSNQAAYLQSIQAAQRRSQNIATKLRMKENEMIEFQSTDSRVASFEEVLAAASAMIGFQLEQSITLSAFNQYQKIIQMKADANKKRNLNGGD